MAEDKESSTMSSQVSDEETVEPPREFDDLGDLIAQIPRKAQKGLLTQIDLKLLCIDANQEYIALGSNVGIVFLYNRKKRFLERLRTKVSDCSFYKLKGYYFTIIIYSTGNKDYIYILHNYNNYIKGYYFPYAKKIVIQCIYDIFPSEYSRLI